MDIIHIIYNGLQELGDAEVVDASPAAGRDGPRNRRRFVDRGGYPKIPRVKGTFTAGWWFLLLPYRHIIISFLPNE